MLLGRVARMHYQHGLTHQEIADALDLSRVRVTRLLAEARATGLVEITVHTDESLFADEERELVDRYNLKQAWIAPSVKDSDKADHAFASVATESIGTLIERNSVVAIGLSATVALALRDFPKRSLGASFVPLSGSSGGLENGSNPHELDLYMASRTGGRAYHLPAPLVAATVQAARSFEDATSIRDVLDLAAHADLAIAGIGSLHPGQGSLFDMLDEAERTVLRERGAVGDLVGRFFDASGVPVGGPLDDRVIGLSLEALQRIPCRLGVARGREKVLPLRAALTAGFINVVMTDINTARALLN